MAPQDTTFTVRKDEAGNYELLEVSKYSGPWSNSLGTFDSMPNLKKEIESHIESKVGSASRQQRVG